MNKAIDPIISIVIVLTVFCASLFMILGEETSLNKQLTASVFDAGRTFLSECLEDADNTFLSNWNQECEGRGSEEKCSLPKDIADKLKADQKEAQTSCH